MGPGRREDREKLSRHLSACVCGSGSVIYGGWRDSSPAMGGAGVLSEEWGLLGEKFGLSRRNYDLVIWVLFYHGELGLSWTICSSL